MVKDTKLYDILEVSPTATEAEISKQYKLLARKYHPDKNIGDESASKKLQELNEAKDILLNPEKRQVYDQFGLDMANGNAGAGPSQEDLFNMFGGFGRQQEKEKENIVINQEVTLEQIYNEHTINIKFQQKNCCQKCGGVTNTCTQCNGKGIRVQIIQMGPMIQQMQSTCGFCRGTGKVANPNSCNECKGEGFKLTDAFINVPLKNGLSNGQQIHLKNVGHNLKGGKTDVIIVIQEKDHPNFKRNGNDLLLDIELKLFQALFGFDKVIKQLDGRNLHISHTGITNYGTKRKIINEGMNDLRTGAKGNIILTFKYKLPIITSPDIITNLQHNLKMIDHEDANGEVEIRINSSKFTKTIMLDFNENDRDPFEGQRNPFEDPRQHQQQCVHQ